MKTCKVLAGMAVAIGLAAPIALAQDSVPGGWSADFEYRSLGPVLAYAADPFATRLNLSAPPRSIPSYTSGNAPARTLGFLGASIGRTTRPKRAR